MFTTQKSIRILLDFNDWAASSVLFLLDHFETIETQSCFPLLVMGRNPGIYPPARRIDFGPTRM